MIMDRLVRLQASKEATRPRFRAQALSRHKAMLLLWRQLIGIPVFCPDLATLKDVLETVLT